jgi:hypothetical protein
MFLSDLLRLSSVYLLPIQMNSTSSSGKHFQSSFSFAEATKSIFATLYPTLATPSGGSGSGSGGAQGRGKSKHQRSLIFSLQSSSSPLQSVLSHILQETEAQQPEFSSKDFLATHSLSFSIASLFRQPHHDRHSFST